MTLKPWHLGCLYPVLRILNPLPSPASTYACLGFPISAPPKQDFDQSPPSHIHSLNSVCHRAADQIVLGPSISSGPPLSQHILTEVCLQHSLSLLISAPTLLYGCSGQCCLPAPYGSWGDIWGMFRKCFLLVDYSS